jgi:hypothetical protein
MRTGLGKGMRKRIEIGNVDGNGNKKKLLTIICTIYIYT